MTTRQLLLIDAITCAVMGVFLATAAAPLARLLDMPAFLLSCAGVLLFPIALLMATLSLQSRPLTAGVWLVVLGNWLWVAASIAVVLVTDANAFGIGFLLLQAIIVALLARKEHQFLRRDIGPAEQVLQ